MKRYLCNLNRKVNFYFWVSFVFTFVYITKTFPSLSYNAEVWAELATNFYQHARFSTLYENIWIPDAGYLPWLQRFIAVMVIKVFKLYDSFPYICQFTGIAFIAFFCSFVNIFQFRKIILVDFIRFVISIILGLGIFSSYDEFTFINFSYYGIFFIVLSFFLDKERFRIAPFIFFLFFSILVINSKSFYVVTAPLFVIFAIESGIKKRYKELFYNLIMISFIMLQAFTMLRNMQIFKTDSANKILNLMKFPISFLNYYLSTILKIFSLSVNQSLFLFPILIVLVIFMYFHIKKKKWDTLKFIFVCLTISAGSITLDLIALLNWSETFSFSLIPSIRMFFFSNYLIWLGFAVLIFSTLTRLSKILRYLPVFLGVMAIYYYADQLEHQTLELIPQVSHSQWRDYKVVLKFDDFCLPINPAPWVYGRNCTELPENSISQANVRAVLLERSFEDIVLKKQIKMIMAFDKFDKPIGTAPLLNTIENVMYSYYLFRERVTPYKLKYYNEKMEEVDMQNKKIKIFGQLK